MLSQLQCSISHKNLLILLHFYWFLSYSNSHFNSPIPRFWLVCDYESAKQSHYWTWLLFLHINNMNWCTLRGVWNTRENNWPFLKGFFDCASWWASWNAPFFMKDACFAASVLLFDSSVTWLLFLHIKPLWIDVHCIQFYKNMRFDECSKEIR